MSAADTEEEAAAEAGAEPGRPDHGRRDARLVLAGSVALLVAILVAAVLSIASAPGPGGASARLVPASALAFARLSTDPDDPAARRLRRLVPRLPGYLGVRDAALTAVSPAPGAFDPRRDVEPWLGDEAAVALVDVGGGRFASLVLAQVRSRPRAEALLQRVAGAQPAVRYRDTVLRRFSGSAAAFTDGFLVAGPEPAVRRALDVSRGGAPALADARAFQAALEGPRRPVEAYLSPRGLRGYLRARPGLPGAVGGLLDRPRLRAVGAALRGEGRGLRADVRVTGGGGAQTRLRLLEGVPASAVAVLAGQSLPAAVGAAQRAGGSAAIETVRSLLRRRFGLDLDRDVLGRFRGEFAAWLEPGAVAPVITVAARTGDPAGTRDALAKLQTPVARALAAQAGARIAFQARTIAGKDAFSLRVSPAFAPTYVVTGDTVVLSTSPAGVEGFLARRPRLSAARGFRAAVPARAARVESLAYVDVRRVVGIGERTGLSLDAFRGVGAAAAVTAREGADTTFALSVEIP
jgi:hypothetical protein